jgi:AcrR family transcriptional regulator
VTKRAKASRGAMLHHFPTRVDLLIATAEYILSSQRDYRRETLSAYPEDWRRFAAVAEVTWKLQQQPATVALLEIMLGSRSDRELRKRVAPLLRGIAAMRAEDAASLAKAIGVDDTQALDDLILIHDASLRGLTINLMFAQEPAQVEAARELLAHYEHTFARGLIARKAAGR